MLKVIRSKLIELARMNRRWNYDTLNEQLELNLNLKNNYDRKILNEWLTDISIDENSKGRPLLSAMATHTGSNKSQWLGFYKFLGEFHQKPWKEFVSDRALENELVVRANKFWSDDKNYALYKNDSDLK